MSNLLLHLEHGLAECPRSGWSRAAVDRFGAGMRSEHAREAAAEHHPDLGLRVVSGFCRSIRRGAAFPAVSSRRLAKVPNQQIAKLSTDR